MSDESRELSYEEREALRLTEPSRTTDHDPFKYWRDIGLPDPDAPAPMAIVFAVEENVDRYKRHAVSLERTVNTQAKLIGWCVGATIGLMLSYSLLERRLRRLEDSRVR